MIIVCGCLYIGCSPQEEAAAINPKTESAGGNILIEADDNAEQNAEEENHLAEISENTADSVSNTLTETNSSSEPDIGEDDLGKNSDKVDEKAEPYIDAYITLSDDTEIEYCEWMEYGEEQVLRVAIQYKEQPEKDYQHKEDYFLFITQDGDVSNIIAVNYEDKHVGAACGFDAHFEDITFDGEEDLLIFIGYAGSGATEFYCAYIYENGEFRYERTFEEIPFYVVDTEKELIYGSNRNSSNSFSDRTYKYIDGEFVLIKEIIRSYEYINGEYVLTETTEYPLKE